MSKNTEVALRQLEEILKPITSLASDHSKDANDWYDEHIAVDTVEFIKHLSSQAVSMQFVEFYGDDREDRFDCIFGGAEGDAWRQDNTYNYNEPYTHSMCIAMTMADREDEAFSIALAPHYGGDVRGNYGDFVVLTFKNYWDYVEACDEFHDTHAYEFTLDEGTPDERWFKCQYNGGGQYYTLAEIGGEGFMSDGFVPEPWTEQDFLKSVRDYLSNK